MTDGKSTEIDTTGIERALDEGRTTLTEPESKALLADAGIDTPNSAVADSADDAAIAADNVGFPVVVKVSSPDVAHKSEWADGAGVAVGLDSAEAVREAAQRIFDAADAAGIDAGVLVEEAANTDAGTEVIVGGLRDRSFGPVVLVGLGGIFTEIYEDTSHRIAPVDHEEARGAIRELTAAPLLAGYRGSAPADIDALASVVTTVGDLVEAHDAIAEIDVNPVLATPDGAVALDALVVLDDGGDAADTGDGAAGAGEEAS